MGEVISINKLSPKIEGAAKCLECKAEWQAVAPVGTTQLECINCKIQKGIFINPVCRFDHPHLTCSCSNDFLHITPSGYYCPRCGDWVLP